MGANQFTTPGGDRLPRRAHTAGTCGAFREVGRLPHSSQHATQAGSRSLRPFHRRHSERPERPNSRSCRGLLGLPNRMSVGTQTVTTLRPRLPVSSRRRILTARSNRTLLPAGVSIATRNSWPATESTMTRYLRVNGFPIALDINNCPVSIVCFVQSMIQPANA